MSTSLPFYRTLGLLETTGAQTLLNPIYMRYIQIAPMHEPIIENHRLAQGTEFLF